MKTLVVGLCVVFGVLFLAGTGLVLYGKTLPLEHTEVITMNLKTTPEKLWKLLTTYEEYPSWWSSVKKVEEEKLQDGVVVSWYTDNHGKRLGYKTTKSNPHKVLVREVVTQKLPFGGTWTFELQSQSANSTHLSITENGFIRPALARLVMRYFIGLRTNLESIKTALETKFNTP